MAAIAVLDEPTRPIAETVRRIGSLAERIGRTRPSYVHVRRYVISHRRRQAAARAEREHLRALLADPSSDATLTRRVVSMYELRTDVDEALERGQRRAPP